MLAVSLNSTIVLPYKINPEFNDSKVYGSVEYPFHEKAFSEKLVKFIISDCKAYLSKETQLKPVGMLTYLTVILLVLKVGIIGFELYKAWLPQAGNFY